MPPLCSLLYAGSVNGVTSLEYFLIRVSKQLIVGVS